MSGRTLCHTLGHAWVPAKNLTLPRYGVASVQFDCDRCGTHRTDSIGTKGKLIGRKYTYDPDYAERDRQGQRVRLTRQEWRAKMIKELRQ
jgi:hypothetical protein